MTTAPSVGIIDHDATGLSRAEFLKRAALGGGVLAIGGIVINGPPRLATAAAPSPEQDARIFNYLLVAEHLQAEFYRRAVEAGALQGELRDFAETVGEHEQQHVDHLTRVLGDDAKPPPSFSFPGDSTAGDAFARTALSLEETASAAYIGQGANLTADRVLDAARIVSVEARHAAWIRDIVGKLPAPRAADEALSQQQVTRALRRAGFLG
jgi:hypothetical protein